MPTVLLVADAGSIHTVRWANALAERGWAVHLLSIRAAREELSGVTLHPLPFGAPAGYFLNVRAVRRAFQEVRPDLVHAHYASGYGTLAALADLHPLVISVWGSDVYEFPATSPLHAWLIRRNLGRSDLVLSTSRAMARHVTRYTMREPRVTPFGIDLEVFRPRKVATPFGPEDIVVGSVKSLAPKYGSEYLVRAFALAKRRLPTAPLKLLLVGGGPQQAQLRRVASALRLDRDVTFTGPVAHGQVPDYQNMLSISVSVSTADSESFGVAVLEASACGKPVVVSSVGGLPEVVEDGVTGIVVPPRDPERTADAIERLASDPELRARMGAAGRERVRRLYDWNRCVDAMLDCYRSLLGTEALGSAAPRRT